MIQQIHRKKQLHNKEKYGAPNSHTFLVPYLARFNILASIGTEGGTVIFTSRGFSPAFWTTMTNSLGSAQINQEPNKQ